MPGGISALSVCIKSVEPGIDGADGHFSLSQSAKNTPRGQTLLAWTTSTNGIEDGVISFIQERLEVHPHKDHLLPSLCSFMRDSGLDTSKFYETVMADARSAEAKEKANRSAPASTQQEEERADQPQ